MDASTCKLHSRAQAFVQKDPRTINARAWLLSDDPDARHCGGCNEQCDPGKCDVDRLAIQWARAELWEQTYHQPHRPYAARDLLHDLRKAVARPR
jgi:hypothetical protein